MKAPTERDRIAMAELSTYDFDFQPPGWEAIDRDDVFAWHWPAPLSWCRGVARATFTDAELGERVSEVARFFARVGRKPRWHVGPLSRSRKLLDLLHERAAAVHEPRDMTAELERVRFRVNPDVRVREITTPELARAWIERSFPGQLTPAQIDDEVATWSLRRVAPTRRGGELVALLDGEVVGSASWRDASDGACVQFVGSWTTPAMRGRGVYSTLCAQRVREALARGFRYACIVADPTTSGPIVAHAGFVDHGAHYIFSDLRL